MSEQNLQLVRRIYEAWNTDGGPAGLAPFMADDIELHDPPDMPDAAVYRGRETAVDIWKERQVLLGLQVDPIEVLDVDENTVVAFIRVSAMGSASGIEFDEVHGHVVDIEDGLMTRVRIFRDRAAVLAAAGLPPDAKGQP